MKELTPYEQFLADKLRNLPVPEEDKAWEEMKKLLEEKDDDRPLIPLWFRGCLPWVLGLLILGLGIVFWYSHQRNKATESSPASLIQKRGSGKEDPAIFESRSGDTVSTGSTNLPAGQSTPARGDIENISSSGTQPASNDGNGAHEGKIHDNNNLRPNGSIGDSVSSTSSPVIKRENEPGKVKRRSSSKSRKTGGKANAFDSNPKQHSGNVELEMEKAVETGGSEVDSEGEKIEVSPQADTLRMAQEADSLKKVLSLTKNSLAKELSADSIISKKDSADKKKAKKPFTFAAGLAVNQIIPVDGEKPVPYDFMGRKGSLSDYIPSVYFRALKPRWFLQTEFRYGAPNNVKEFVYSSKTSTDTFQNSVTATKTLKKTFYHQVPLTFNYFVLKNWSVGVGIAYNKFTRAVRQEDVRLRIPGSNLDTLLSSNLVQNGRDSAFVSNSFQWIAETQYRWRRFSIGFRYAQGLQPYIKYTDPQTGLPAEKKNQSLNAFIRYDLWRSKKR